MRVMGVDPGLTRCGVGVVEGVPGRPLRLVHVTVVRTAPDEEHALRLLGVERGIEALMDELSPDAVAVERVFSQHNVRTVMGTAQAAGIAMLAAARRGLPVALHTPSEAKAAVTGNGRADKAQVTAMVTRLLQLEAAPRPADAADALALAICHVWRGGPQARLARAQRSRIEDAARAERERLAARTGTPSRNGPPAPRGARTRSGDRGGSAQ
ncbi:crossover junction endodeoxyribonuclease RuvC [Actinomadura fibrosa]|uniref:Crossover junction endodeoxyribonuclease RuvC n=1 Tax=Actinomadura fibrosa TaxID=111802 RepID=A0ABW2XKE7_9ACTN|nr:crossover junction endodeoxyribonuclease RuvC [Actinomadura fibrosa]